MKSEAKDMKLITLKNLFWRFAERCGAQGIAFVVSIILARILSPEDYGVIALVTVFTSILQVFVESGLGTALIQKRNADNVDFSTVFYANIFFCIILYCIAYITAPTIAKFYENDSLCEVFRVLSLIVLLSGIKNVQQAYVSRNLMFKKFFLSTLVGISVSGIVGITLAYAGYGVWALVAQQVINVLIDTVILWITVKWRPERTFSLKRLKALLAYGWKILLSNLINTIYNDIRQLIIGKMYSSTDLAFYNRGKQFPSFIVNNINASIDSVLLPVMASCQDKKEDIKRLTRRSIKISGYIMWPLMLGLIAIAEPVIQLILSDKWLVCVPYLRIFCFVYGMMPIHTANLNAIKAMGRSDLYLKMEIIKKSVGLLLVMMAMREGVLAIGISSVLYTFLAGIVNAYPNKKILGYSLNEQLEDILPAFLLSTTMAIGVYCFPIQTKNLYIIVLIKLLVGCFLYMIESWVFKIEAFSYIVNIFRKFIEAE